MRGRDDTRSASAGQAPSAHDAPLLTRAAWARILPFLASVFFIAAADALERLGVSAGALRWLYPIKIAVVRAWTAPHWSFPSWKSYSGVLF